MALTNLNNEQLLKEIHNMVIVLNERSMNMKEQLDKITPIFQPNGICDKSRRMIDRLDTSNKNNARITYLLLGAIITLSFFVIRIILLKN